MELSLPRKISGQIKSTPTIGAGLTNTRLGRQHKHFGGSFGLAPSYHDKNCAAVARVLTGKLLTLVKWALFEAFTPIHHCIEARG
jgi:hypothetical protein